MSAVTLWVHTPSGQQASGLWVDDALRCHGGSAVPETGETRHEPLQRIEAVRAADPEAAVNELFHERGWTDGLPIVAPSLARVRAMLQFSALPAATVIGDLEPMLGQATVEKVAVCAVMAGARPEYLPVILAAVAGIADPAFNRRGVQTTDENVTPLLVVSGPIAAELGINSGAGALGPGCRANATIGRAVRLAMINIGGGRTGSTSLAGIGQPGRYTLCVAEDQEASPWPALHTESGLPAGASAVTVLRAECSINVTGGLEEIASVMGSAASAFSVLHGGCVAVLLAPATAKALAEKGWSKQDIASHLHQAGRIPHAQWLRMWVRQHIAPDHGLPDWVEAAQQDGSPIPVVRDPDDIVIFVAGARVPIAQQVYFPTWGFPRCRLALPVQLPSRWSELRAGVTLSPPSPEAFNEPQ
jgi:hypothetical protein